MQACNPHQRQWLRDVVAELHTAALLEQLNVRVAEIHRMPDGSVSALITLELAASGSPNDLSVDSQSPIEVYLGVLPLGERWSRLGETLTALSRHQQTAAVIRLDQIQHPNRVVVRLRRH